MPHGILEKVTTNRFLAESRSKGVMKDGGRRNIAAVILTMWLFRIIKIRVKIGYLLYGL